MPYFIKSELFAISACKSLHLGLTSAIFKVTNFRCQNTWQMAVTAFDTTFPQSSSIQSNPIQSMLLVAAVWNQRVPSSDGPIGRKTPLPPSLARTSLRPGTSCSGYSCSMGIQTEKICLDAALQAAEHQSRSQLNKFPSDVNLEVWQV